MKVVYIISDHRSGSTLLENILSQNIGVVSVGELRLLKGHFLKEGPGKMWNWNCSCGQSVSDCEFWKNNYLKLNPNGLETKVAFKGNVISEVMGASPHGESTIDNLYRIYSRINDTQKVSVIVDSSKDWKTGLLLRKKFPNEVILINLKRNFRQVAASKIIRKQSKRENHNPYKILYGCWKHQNLQSKIDNLCDVSFNYEDLIFRRKETINLISKKVGIEIFSDSNIFGVSTNDHSIAGTPSRFTKNVIKFDDKSLAFYKDNTFLRLFANGLAIFEN